MNRSDISFRIYLITIKPFALIDQDRFQINKNQKKNSNAILS